MFDNVAFDVVLGLVLVYLLYSLLTTLVGEMLASWMGIRQRLLRFSIERMLNDGTSVNTSLYRRLMIMPNRNFKNSLAGKFYDYPSIKYLSKGQPGQLVPGAQTKPAYLTAEYFADTLTHLLADNGSGDTVMDQVRFCLQYNTLLIEADTVQHIRNLFQDAYGRLDMFQKKLIDWFNETQDRNNGWYKNKVRIILFTFGFVLAIVFNVDSIRIAHILSIDKQARNQLANMGIAMARDSARYKDLRSLSGNPLDSTPPSRAVLDSGLSHISKDLSSANQILGLGWDFSDKLIPRQEDFDSLNDRDEYRSIVRTVRAFTTVHRASFSRSALDSLAAIVQVDLDKIFLSNTSLQQQQLDIIRTSAAQTPDSPAANAVRTIATNAVRMIDPKLAGLTKKRRQLDSDSSKYRADLFLYLSALKAYQQAETLIDSIACNKFTRIDAVHLAGGARPQLTIDGQREYHWYGKLGYILGCSFGSLSLLGFLLTALALSMGAPFWFDLLNRLVSIRGSGIKPEEKKARSGGSGGPADPVPAPNPNPTIISAAPPAPGSDPDNATIEAALSVYGSAISAEDGVLSAHKGYFFTGGKANDCLQVTVMNAGAQKAINDKYGNLELFKHIRLQVDITGEPQITIGQTPGAGDVRKGVANSTKLFGWGSFGFLATDNDDNTKRYIVSCYHVLNGDLNWKNTGTDRSIINQNRVISSDYEGCLNEKVDAAYAGPLAQPDYDFYSSFKPKGKTAVSNANVGQPVSFSGLMSSGSGTIVNDSCPAKFSYPLEPGLVLKNPMTDLIAASTFDDKNQRVPISKKGDSGALVVDKDGKALGLIVGVDQQQTYIIKIGNIESQLSITLDC